MMEEKSRETVLSGASGHCKRTVKGILTSEMLTFIYHVNCRVFKGRGGKFDPFESVRSFDSNKNRLFWLPSDSLLLFLNQGLVVDLWLITSFMLYVKNL